MVDLKYDYIEFHCPHCGKNYDIEYDRVLAELNINTGMYLMNK